MYLERGLPIQKHHIAIRFFVVHGNLQTQAGGQGQRDTEEQWLYIHQNANTKQALSKMCNQMGVSTKKHRL